MPQGANDVPVFVDAAIGDPEFAFVRCSYLYVGREELDPPGTSVLDTPALIFTIIGLTGVLTQPVGGTRFTSAGSIDETYEAIETEDYLSIHTSDLWLPTSLFEGTLIPGQVYRLSRALFADALRYRLGISTRQEFWTRVSDRKDECVASPVETAAFGVWRAFVLDETHRSPKDATLHLRPEEPR